MIRRLAAALAVTAVGLGPVLLAGASPAAAVTCSPGSLDGLSASQITDVVNACWPNAADPGDLVTEIETYLGASTPVAVSETAGGVMALEVGGAASTGIIAAGTAGVAAGTCAVLQALPWWNNHSCSAGLARVVGWVTGSNGDNRGQLVAAPGTVSLTSTDYYDQTFTLTTSASPPFGQLQFHVVGPSGTMRVYARITCFRTDAPSTTQGPNSFDPSSSVAYNLDNGGSTGITDYCSHNSTGWPAGTPAIKRYTLRELNCPSGNCYDGTATDTGTDVVTYSYDPPQPWTVKAVTWCKAPDGTLTQETGTASAAATPDPSTSYTITLPTCPTGTSEIADGVQGGRTTDTGTAIVPVDKQQGGTTTTTTGSSTTTQTQTGTNPTVGSDGTTQLLDCMGGIWSWDPVDWVVVPLKCTFAPDPAVVQSQLAQLKTNYDASPFGAVTQSVSDIGGGIVNAYSTISDGGDCNGPQLPAIPQVGLTDPSYPFQTCTDPTATWAAWFRPIATVIVVLGATWVGVTIICHTFGIRMIGEKYPEQQLALF